jgi:hypothetical protein
VSPWNGKLKPRYYDAEHYLGSYYDKEHYLFWIHDIYKNDIIR